MWFPMLRGHIERRMLVNFRLRPDVAQPLLPKGFAPKLTRGHAMAGVCLIRMARLRPAFLPFSPFGTSENAALRFAVTWRQDGEQREGVYIPERFTTSRFAALAGGRVFPGAHHLAAFDVEESAGRFRIAMRSRALSIAVEARIAERFAGSVAFETLDEASRYFRDGAVGYSPRLGGGDRLDAVELSIPQWAVHPLSVDRVECDFFDDPQRFPPGTAVFDHALLMTDVGNEFRNRPAFCCQAAHRPETLAAAAASA